MERASAGAAWREVDALFAEAIEVPATKRDAFLRRACAGRLDLMRRVEDLLDASDAGAAYLERFSGLILDRLPDALDEVVGFEADAAEADLTGRRIDRYRILRPLARGGMGTVYLAERADGAFDRRVALKLLRRGLDTDDVLARFRAERQILADLEHPNIARLIDGGSTGDGRPYLVMEYVDGTPITDFCTRRGLDLDERLKLFRSACGAVHHAHVHGVVHRDLKPSNILVSEQGEVKLLDFGIARLLHDDRGEARTRTGLRLMTPDYASPEQVRGEPVTEASDVYQLGLLLYELVTGERAFRVSRLSAAEIERVVCEEQATPPSRHVPPPLARRLRRGLDAITLAALRKEPARRYASAEALASDVHRYLEGRPVDAVPESVGFRVRRHVERYRVRLAASVALAAAAVALLLAGVPPGLRPSSAAPPVPGHVAILPFRVAGADPSLGYLREGMVDLLSTKLTGEGGPRALSTATVMTAWERAGGSAERGLPEARALALAREVGAGQLLVGDVVGTEESIVLNASLLRVEGGRAIASASVSGPADSLLSLVDQLTGRLLILGAGEQLRPLGVLATTSLPALRAYLDGRVDLRAARYLEAYERFNRAIELDSTFALAAIKAYQAAWLSPRGGSPRLLELAWRGRDRLDGHDRVYLDGALGPNYPAPFPQAERLAIRRHMVETWPDQSEARYMLADRLFHWHALLELPGGREESAAQFRRVLEVDSTYAPAIQHLVPLLYALGEDGEADRLVDAYLRRQPDAAIRSYLVWRKAAAGLDTVVLSRLHAAMDTLETANLVQIARGATQAGLRVEDAERAFEVLRTRGLTPALARRVLREDYIFRLLRGRPGDAAAVARELARAQADEPDFPHLEARHALVLSALYGDGDAEAARPALEALTRAAFGGDGTPREDARPPDLCTVAQWRLWNGDRTGVDAAMARLASTDNRDILKDTGPVCAILLAAIDAVLQRRPDARDRLARLDSALVTGPQMLVTELEIPANIASAWLNERLGNPERALAAARRRTHGIDSSTFLLDVSLRLEGRLAAAAGDLDDAVRPYRHYLALRYDPAPVLRPQADSVRAALAELESALRASGG